MSWEILRQVVNHARQAVRRGDLHDHCLTINVMKRGRRIVILAPTTPHVRGENYDRLIEKGNQRLEFRENGHLLSRRLP
ncbi:hypothetical protein [Streptomyces sp. WG7]|uniref:hypothetical protein n=1 Tax=Streptomyces sp. WG7 TaxID=3417650 RepID=UPI003CF58BF9